MLMHQIWHRLNVAHETMYKKKKATAKKCIHKTVTGEKAKIRTWYVHFPLICAGLLPSEDTSYWVSNWLDTCCQ